MEHYPELTTNLLANNGKRFLNYLIDLAFQYGIGYLLGFVLGYMYIYLNIETPYLWVTNMNKLEELFLSYMIMLVYYTFFETLFQRSPAKFITGTRVINHDGSKPSFGTIVKRTFCRMIPFDHFSYLGEAGKGWHDSIPEAYVIDVKKYEEAKYLKNSFDEIGSEIKDNLA